MLRLDHYQYHLPKEMIATRPASPRDSARLFVYDTKEDKVVFDTFRNLDNYLPKPSLLVMNNTKVVPARLSLTKEFFPERRVQRGGGKVEVLLMMNEYKDGDAVLRGVADHNLLLGTKLFFHSHGYIEVVGKEEQFFLFRPRVPMAKVWRLLQREGQTPIPPYIKESDLNEKALRKKYQSVLAAHPASVAAPTASLHFTKRLLDKLSGNNIVRTEITLHVGAGTFIPITDKHIEEKKIIQ